MSDEYQFTRVDHARRLVIAKYSLDRANELLDQSCADVLASKEIFKGSPLDTEEYYII